MMIGLGLYRVLTLSLAACENLLFSGIMFGWVTLVYIFKQEGYFSHLCSPTNDTIDSFQVNTSTQMPVQPSASSQADISLEDGQGFPSCPEQDAELQLIFTIATFCYEFLLFPMGMIWDKFGTLVMRLLSSCLILAGLLLIAFSSVDRPHLLFPACTFLTVGGLELMITSLQISNLFGRRKSTVMAFLSGCLDSSAFVLVIIKLGYDMFGVSLQTSFFALAGTCLLFSFNILLLPKTGHIPYPLPPNYRQEKPMATEGVVKDDSIIFDTIEMKEMSEPDTSAKVEDTTPSQNATEAVKNKRYPSLCSCFLSWPALCLLIWFSLLQLNFFFFLGTFNSQLERLVDNDQTIVSRYTTILTIYQACSLFISPLCGILLDRNRTQKNMAGSKRGPYDDLLDSRLAFALTTSLYIAFNITLLIDVVELRYFSFLLHIITRSFMYSLVVTGCSLFFPVNYFGSTLGLIETSASLVGLLQRPMFAIQQNYLDNDSFWLFIVFIVLNIMTFLLPIYIHFDVKRALKIEDKDEDRNSSST